MPRLRKVSTINALFLLAGLSLVPFETNSNRSLIWSASSTPISHPATTRPTFPAFRASHVCCEIASVSERSCQNPPRETKSDTSRESASALCTIQHA